MNRFLRLGVIALGLAALPAFSQTNPATIPTSITIIAPITFTVGATLNFGTVTPTSVAGTDNDIHVSAPLAARTISGSGNGQLSAAAPIAAVGTSSMVSGLFSLTVTASGLTTAGAGLILKDVTMSHDGGVEASISPTGVTFTPIASPTALSFGGTMNVATAAVPGTFAGSFVVTGTYN
jgi:hypothetical protein